MSGNTPRHVVKGRASKALTHHITSRIIGVEVHCGPVHGTLLYYTDDLTKGGSNKIIEVTRQGELIRIIQHMNKTYYSMLNILLLFIAILDLQILLTKQPHDKSDNLLDLPRSLILQFDNCAENKVFIILYIFLLQIKREVI